MLGFLLLSACDIENEVDRTDPIKDPLAILQVEPHELNFGDLRLGEDNSLTFTVQNLGDGALTVDEIVIDGPNAFALTLPEGPISVEGGASEDITVTYTADLANPYANAVITTSVGIERVELAANAMYPFLVADPDPWDFRVLETGQHDEGELRLVNDGEDTLVIDAVALSGLYMKATVQAELPVSLEPGESIPVLMEYDPLENGMHLGELWVNSNSPDSPRAIDLWGAAGLGVLTGRICGPNADGYVAGANVFISADTNNDGVIDWTISDLTDGEGYFQLVDVPAGTWTVNVTKGSWSTEFEVVVSPGNNELAEEECLDPESVKVAVVTGYYDSIHVLLNEMDVDFDVYGEQTYLNKLLLDPDKMAEYDIIFFNCGMQMNWLAKREEVAANLVAFVADGNSVYASDWAHNIVEAAWPAAIDFRGDDSEFIDPFVEWDEPYTGVEGKVDGRVLDGSMKALLGDSIDLTYDLGGWVVPQGVGQNAAPMVKGDANLYNVNTQSPSGTQTGAPLAVRIGAGGTVIYTTFHNEPQLDEAMREALKEIILSL
jgi:hypothetical protein